MKIYVYPLSAPCRFVMSVAKHANIAFEPVEVDLMAQEQKSEAHMKRHPQGKVPVMEDGDFTLFESSAIVRYMLDTKAPGNTLYPTDTKIRAKINQVIGALNDLRGAQFVVTAGKVMLPRQGKSMPEKILTFGETQYKTALTKINEMIGDKKHIIGESITICDFLFCEMIMNAMMIKTDFENDYPKVHAYYTGIINEVPTLKEDETCVKDVIEMMS